MDEVGLLELFSRYSSLMKRVRDFNVVGIRIQGEYGVIQSDISDLCILPSYAITGHWAAATNHALVSFFSRNPSGGMYIDVGANIGLTTIPIAQNPAVKCIAIEPEPSNFRNLVTNIAENCRHDNVETLQMAAFSCATTVTLELSPDNLGDHRLRLLRSAGKLQEDQRKTIDVRGAPLDDIVESFRRPLAIKVDTQGAEPFVLEGGQKIFDHADLVIIEFWPYGMAQMRGDFEEVLNYLECQFRTVTFLGEPASTANCARSAKIVTNELREAFHEHVLDHHFYLDLMASR